MQLANMKNEKYEKKYKRKFLLLITEEKSNSNAFLIILFIFTIENVLHATKIILFQRNLCFDCFDPFFVLCAMQKFFIFLSH